MKRSFLATVLVVLVLFLASCSKNAENEHLPEYCQTYAGFTSTASRDMFELLDDAGYSVNRFNYLSVISEIELEFELDDPNRTVDLGGIQCFQNLTSLSLSGRSFKDISDISALSNIQAIQLRNTSVVSIDSFKNLSKINHLVISDTKTLQNVEGVGEMTKLTTLDLSNNGLVNIGELNDLVNLQHLYLDHNDIIYFPSINNLEQLITLDMSYNDIIQLGDDLSGLRNLEELNASNNQICDISTLDDLESVEELDLSYNDLGCNGAGISPNFDSLENAVNLRILKLNNNGLTSIEGLRDRDISLEVLHLHNNQLSDITPIAAYTDITELVLYNNSISNLNDLSGMTGLTSIDLSENNISSLTDLMLITNLTHIDLSENNVSVIPDISAQWPNLSVLDLHSNPLVDVSGVEGHPSLETLILYNSGLTVLEGISNLPELDTLVIVDEELEAELDPIDQNPNVISVLIDSFNNNPSLPIQQDFILDLGFEFGPNVEIYNSIQGNVSVGGIQWAGLDIDIIDETSIQLPNLIAINVSNNNLTDIRFILGNPDLEMLNLSGNAISNISVISGTDTEDLDNLTLVEVENNAIGSNLQNAFIDLPSIEEISLIGTPIVLIDNSFNNLGSLITLDLTGNFLQSITDSFNNLYSQYRSTNQFAFDDGNIATIDNSFNGGQYNTISITNQTPIIGVSSIVDSFNDLNIVGEDGIDLSGNEFTFIIESFQRVTTDVIDLSNNELFAITAGFNESEIEVLDLSNNLLGSVPGLNEATDISTLLLNDNELTTLSFIDGIPGLSTLSFERQETVLGVDTLTILDGINNQLEITTFTGDLTGITSITGLQNTGIVDLDLSVTEMGVSSPITIGVDAFSGTSLVSLNLAGQELSDLSFLSNLTTIQQLHIGLDVADLTDLIGLPMETTLEDLTFTNLSPLSDFTPLAGYDLVETLTLPSNLINIEFLDGMDSVQVITMNEDSIVTITDSFNVMPSFEPNEVYLESFTNLTTITRSFDLYGSIDNTIDYITISGDYNIVDSFRNVAHLTIENNALHVTPTFDSDSFTVVESIFFESAAYNSYAFLNGYTALTSVTIADLDTDITDLSNTTLDIVSISSNSVTLSTISVTMADTGTFLFNSLAASDFDITVNASDVTLESDNGNMTVTALNSVIALTGESNDFVLNGANVTTLELGNFSATNVTFNTPVLNQVTQLEVAIIALNLDIYTSVLQFNIDARATNLTIHDDNISSLIINNEGYTTTVIGNQPTLSIDAIATTLVIDYDALETLTMTGGTVQDLVVDSLVFETLDLDLSVVIALDITSNATSMRIIRAANGNIVQDVTITNDALTTLTSTISIAQMSLASNSSTLTLGDMNVSLGLDLSAMPNLSELHYGTATLNTITIDSNSTTMHITGQNGITINYTTTTLQTLVLDTPSSEITLSDSAATLIIDGSVDSITLDGTSIDTLIIASESTITTLTIPDAPTLSTIATNDSTIGSITLATGDTSFALDGTNVSTTTITGLSLDTALIDVGTNTLSLITGSADLGLTAVANLVSLTSSAGTITVDNSSVITTLTGLTDSLISIATGTADITTLELQDASGALIVSGTGMDTVILNVPSISIIATLDPTTELDVTSPNGATTDITTNATSITLSDSTFATYNISSTATSLHIVSPLNTISIDGASVATLEITATDSPTTIASNVLTMTILGTTTNLTIDNDSLTSLNVVGVTLDNLTVNSTSLSTIDVLDAVSNNLVLETNQASLTISGNVNGLILTDDTVTSLNVTGLTSNQLIITANSLSSVDTGDAVFNGTLTIDTGQAIFDLTTNATTVTYSSSVGSDLSITSDLNGGTMVLTTNSDTLDLTAPTMQLDLTGTNLTTITGTIDTMETGGFTNLSLILGLTGNEVTITDPGSVTSILYSDGHTVNTLSIESTSLVTSIDTNTASIGTLEINVDSTILIALTTSSSNVDISAEALGGFTEVQLSYEGTNPLEVNYTGLTTATINMNTEDTLTLSGAVSDMTIVGNNLSTFTTILFSADTLTITNTTLTSLDFASASLLGGLSTLDINTLSNANMVDIITPLVGTSLTLISPITETDIYDYYYAEELARLTAQEAIDNAYYDSIRSAAIDDSWVEIEANQYMDHLDQPATRTAIDNDTLGDEDFYFNSYLTDAGITAGELAVGEETTIRNAITATLNQITLLMDEPTLQADTTAAIEADADTFAQTETSNITFTIG